MCNASGISFKEKRHAAAMDAQGACGYAAQRAQPRYGPDGKQALGVVPSYGEVTFPCGGGGGSGDGDVCGRRAEAAFLAWLLNAVAPAPAPAPAFASGWSGRGRRRAGSALLL